jgi:hypothetical protein
MLLLLATVNTVVITIFFGRTYYLSTDSMINFYINLKSFAFLQHLLTDATSYKFTLTFITYTKFHIFVSSYSQLDITVRLEAKCKCLHGCHVVLYSTRAAIISTKVVYFSRAEAQK